MSEDRFLSVLKEAKDLFLERLQAEEKLKAENGKFLEDIKQLKSENEKLSLENKRLVGNVETATENLERVTEEVARLTEKLKNSKKFVKVYFKDQLNRIKEIEKNGIYNAETFSYLVGDIGRSLCNTTLNETNSVPTTNKKPSQGRLSTNKENRRARYEDVEPSKDCRSPWTTLNKDNKQTTIKIGKWQDIFYNGKSNNEQHPNTNKQTLDSATRNFSNQEHLKNPRRASNKNSNLEIKNSIKPQEIQNFLDPDLTLCLPIGPPFKSSTQMESDNLKEKFNNTTQTAIPSQEILKNQKTIPNTEDNHFLDPDLTIRSPIGPPSKSSTPQGPTSGEEPKKFTLAFSPPQTSPSLLSNEDNEGLRCTLLPQILSMEGEVPEQTQPQSPTILTWSHSFTRTTILAAASPDHRTPKRKRNDMSFGSLLASGCSRSKQEIVNDSTGLGERRARLASEDESRNQSSKIHVKNHTLSPDIIVLDDSDFVKPNSTDVPRKKPKTSVANESAMNTSSLLFSPPRTSDSPAPSSSKTRQSDNESNEMGGNEEIDQQKPKIALNFNLDESTENEKNPDREEEKSPQYKYREVVRGKDKRAKLNGYFCADCEKYYGSLKLSEAEIQERLKACSRHRARFSPPPSTPEHFWQVDFMNTNEYIEKGFMRTESELPPEKRKLKSRRFKLGKQQKY